MTAHPTFIRSCLLILAALFAFPAAPVRAQQDPIFESSVYLLRSSLTSDRRGQFSTLIRSLRLLEDPELKAYFQELVNSDDRVMKVHGLLGLAEIDPKRQLDLKLFAEVRDPVTQSAILAAALDSELLNVANAKQIMGWKDLDADAKIVVAQYLLEKKEFNDLAMLREGAKLREPPAKDIEALMDRQPLPGFRPSNPANPAKAVEEYREMFKNRQWARRGVVALMQVQLGDPAGEALLESLSKSSDQIRDVAQEMVLQTAVRFKYEKIAPWAAKLSTQPGVSEALGLNALRTAMRFGHPESMRVWTQRFNSAVDVADRIRLAVSLLNLAPYVDAAMFDPLIASTDELLKKIGAAGKAVASKKGIPEAVAALIAMDHSISNAWALGYAHLQAAPEDARAIFTEMIQVYEKGDVRNKTLRRDQAMSAAYAFYEKDPAAASKVLLPILNSGSTDKMLVQGIYAALIRVNKGEPQKLAQDVTRVYDEPNSNGLRLLLLAKHGVTLTPQQLRDLGLLVRGGGAMPDGLRLQAGWVYLKQTKQTGAALEKAKKV